MELHEVTREIEALLVCELNAGTKITKARKRREIRIKEAKAEGALEVNKIRIEKDQKFKSFEEAHLGNEDVLAKISRDMQVQMDDMIRLMSENRDNTVKMLMDLICSIKPTIHPNLQLKLRLAKRLTPSVLKKVPSASKPTLAKSQTTIVQDKPASRPTTPGI